MEKRKKEREGELAATSIRLSQIYRVCKIPGRSEFTSDRIRRTIDSHLKNASLCVALTEREVERNRLHV